MNSDDEDDFDLDEIMDGKDAMMQEIIAGMNGLVQNKGPEQAEEIMQRQMIQKEKILNVEALELQDLHFMLDQNWPTLQEIFLGRNAIMSIDPLSQYSNLKVLDAPNNYIEAFDLTLPKLEVLNLSNNYIKVFPALTGLEKLRELNLNTNQLNNSVLDAKPQLTPSLRVLDLGSN